MPAFPAAEEADHEPADRGRQPHQGRQEALESRAARGQQREPFGEVQGQRLGHRPAMIEVSAMSRVTRMNAIVAAA